MSLNLQVRKYGTIQKIVNTRVLYYNTIGLYLYPIYILRMIFIGVERRICRGFNVWPTVRWYLLWWLSRRPQTLKVTVAIRECKWPATNGGEPGLCARMGRPGLPTSLSSFNTTFTFCRRSCSIWAVFRNYKLKIFQFCILMYGWFGDVFTQALKAIN